MQLDPRLARILKKIGELDDGFAVEASQELRSDLDIDSLKMIDVVLAVEKEFGIELDVDALARVQTAGEFQQAIEFVRAA
jgi:acyl carrier protein